MSDLVAELQNSIEETKNKIRANNQIVTENIAKTKVANDLIDVENAKLVQHIKHAEILISVAKENSDPEFRLKLQNLMNK